ncbi:MAG: hypothetical protein ABIP93_04495 [Gemmatimonadaceae bacterium]
MHTTEQLRSRSPFVARLRAAARAGSRARRPLLVSTIALLSACAGDSPTMPSSSLSSASLAANRSAGALATRAMGGTCTTTLVADFSVPGVLRLQIAGECRLEHLGRTTMTAVQTVSLVDGSAQNFTTYTAANGDELYTRWDGQVISPPGPEAVFVGTETYVGGTGRFAGASGSSWLEGTATLIGLTGEYTTKGSITY